MEINSFKARWSRAEKKGEIILFLKLRTTESFSIDNPAEFNSILLILQGNNKAFYNTDNGEISTGRDKVDSTF